MVIDNGSSLCSDKTKIFLKNNGVFHIKTAPYNPSSNGAAENLVHIFKNFFKKCSLNSDLETNNYKFLLAYNNFKNRSTGISPAQLHLGTSRILHLIDYYLLINRSMIKI